MQCCRRSCSNCCASGGGRGGGAACCCREASCFPAATRSNRCRPASSVVPSTYWTHFGAFTCEAFKALNPGQRLIPNWHIDAICYHVQQMLTGEARKRLILNLPPRTFKSSIASVALPACLLGRNPSTRIICASYSDELATKFSRGCRALLETPFYKRVFPGAKLNPRKASESEFETTKRGYRLATSVGGTLTGRGGDVLIVDDPLKANEEESQVARQGALDLTGSAMLPLVGSIIPPRVSSASRCSGSMSTTSLASSSSEAGQSWCCGFLPLSIRRTLRLSTAT